MTDLIKNHPRKALIYACAVLAVSYLSFKGLTYHYMWDDEAYAAYFAKTFLKTGKLTGWESFYDGRNLYTYRNEHILSGEAHVYSAPLDILTAAASFAVLGPSTFSARLPFVLLGLAALFLFFLLLRTDFPNAPPIRYYAFGALALSYSFLLSIRQCRYYALGFFFVIASFLFYRKFIKTGRLVHLISLTGALLGLFFSNYLFCAAFAIPLTAVHFMFHRNAFSKKQWVYVGIAAAVCMLAVLPYAVMHKVWRVSWLEEGTSSLAIRIWLIFWYFRDLDMAGYIPLLLLAPFGALLFFQKYRKLVPPVVQEYAVVCFGYILMVGILSPQYLTKASAFEGLADIRYAAITLPFATVLIGVALFTIEKGYGRAIAVIVFLLLTCTNIFSLNIAYNKFRWLLPAYLHEIHNDYTTAYEAAITHINEHAEQNDTLYAVPEYATSPFLFYSGHKIIVGGTRRKGTFEPVESLKELGFPLTISDYYPHWIVSFAMTNGRQKQLQWFSRGRYTYDLVKYINVHWRNMTRPELPWHSFSEPEIPNKASGIYVYKRKPKETAGGG